VRQCYCNLFSAEKHEIQDLCTYLNLACSYQTFILPLTVRWFWREKLSFNRSNCHCNIDCGSYRCLFRDLKVTPSWSLNFNWHVICQNKHRSWKVALFLFLNVFNTLLKWNEVKVNMYWFPHLYYTHTFIISFFQRTCLSAKTHESKIFTPENVSPKKKRSCLGFLRNCFRRKSPEAKDQKTAPEKPKSKRSVLFIKTCKIMCFIILAYLLLKTVQRVMKFSLIILRNEIVFSPPTEHRRAEDIFMLSYKTFWRTGLSRKIVVFKGNAGCGKSGLLHYLSRLAKQVATGLGYHHIRYV